MLLSVLYVLLGGPTLLFGVLPVALGKTTGRGRRGQGGDGGGLDCWCQIGHSVGVGCRDYWSRKLDAGAAAWTAVWTVGVGHLVGVHGW